MLVAFFATTLSIGGVVYFAADTKPPTKKKEIATELNRKTGAETAYYKTAPQEAKTAINTALLLYQRREAGDEPTESEWRAAEAAIDDLRARQDSPELRKIDRMLEVREASTAVISEELKK